MFGGENKAKPTRAPVVKAQLVCCEIGDMEGSKVDTVEWKYNIYDQIWSIKFIFVPSFLTAGLAYSNHCN